MMIIALPSKQYAGCYLSPEPLHLTLEQVSSALRRGTPVSVDLSPGDGTQYHLLLTPVKGMVGAMLPGWRCRDHDRLLLVTLTTNSWTQELLAWWFQCLNQTYDHDL